MSEANRAGMTASVEITGAGSIWGGIMSEANRAGMTASVEITGAGSIWGGIMSEANRDCQTVTPIEFRYFKRIFSESAIINININLSECWHYNAKSTLEIKTAKFMKRKDIVPTDKERFMREHDFIVSKTDLTGRIIYGNEIFIEFSGYEEHELLGSQHNIICHPDMPRVVFKLLWDYLAEDKEIFAYIKNMSKDGSFYWVFTHVAPIVDKNKQKIGYTSVRRMPNPKAISIVTEVYQSMLDAEKQAGTKDAMAASGAILGKALKDKGVSYEELINVLQSL